jgi:hypothetical protein
VEWQTRTLEVRMPSGMRVRLPPVTPVIKYSKELLEDLAKDCTSVRQVMVKLGLKATGGTHSHLSKKFREYEIDISHFLGKAANVGKAHQGGCQKLSAEDVLVYDRNNGRREYAHKLRRALIESGVPELCDICSLKPEWQGQKLVLQIDHIDGDFLNNCKKNLRFICPNCHSQTENFGSRNIK